MTSKLDQAEWKLDCIQSRMDALSRRVDADPCWEGYEQRGTKEKGGGTVPNCVKADASDDTWVVANNHGWFVHRPKFGYDNGKYTSRYNETGGLRCQR